MREGFYTALGTPLDEEGQLVKESFIHQIEDQIRYGAAGFLIMGSMGMGVFIRNSTYREVAEVGAAAVKKACPVFVGVTDTCISRVCDRIHCLHGLPIDGVVATAPYYQTVTDRELILFYGKIAQQAPYPVYLYDLPSASRNKITIQTMMGLKDVKNIKGIKTGDFELAKTLENKISAGEYPADFHVLYSGLDHFDEAYKQGIKKNLDGMFACTGQLAESMYRALAAGDFKTGSERLRDIVRLRDIFAEEQIFPSFTYAMNLLGYDGLFHPDYFFMPSPAQKEKIKACMAELHFI